MIGFDSSAISEAINPMAVRARGRSTAEPWAKKSSPLPFSTSSMRRPSRVMMTSMEFFRPLRLGLLSSFAARRFWKSLNCASSTRRTISLSAFFFTRAGDVPEATGDAPPL